MRVLIVENEKSASEILQGYLSDYGHCCVAVDGQQALDEVRKSLNDRQPYGLICLDLMIPQMDGHDVLRAIRQIEKEYKINKSSCAKVIVITTLSDFNNIANAFRADCQGYLVKPVGKDDLLEQIQKLGLLSSPEPPTHGFSVRCLRL